MTECYELIEEFNALLETMSTEMASDLHLSSGDRAFGRIHGHLRPLGERVFSEADLSEITDQIMTTEQKETFENSRSVDIGYSFKRLRFRMNVYLSRGRKAMAVRLLDGNLTTLSSLNLPPQLAELAHLKSGLVLVSGITGSGKSSTLSALLTEINETRADHVITIEDPIEFIYDNQKALFHQREVHRDVPDFASAVRASLREDPDVIMVGEMRDLETMRAVLVAAESGHLVFSTLHTASAVGVIERFVGAFPNGEQELARYRLGMVLKAVIAQKLLPIQNGQGRIPAIEYLVSNSAVANLIVSGKSKQIFSVIESGKPDGMQTLDQSLAILVKEKWITLEDAVPYCRDETALRRAAAIM